MRAVGTWLVLWVLVSAVYGVFAWFVGLPTLLPILITWIAGYVVLQPLARRVGGRGLKALAHVGFAVLALIATGAVGAVVYGLVLLWYPLAYLFWSAYVSACLVPVAARAWATRRVS